jgi:HPt (histidine-containing phosphotransfer) domain-containing protein/acyl-coenzyme A thioesterase PaaI-like protein
LPDAATDTGYGGAMELTPQTATAFVHESVPAIGRLGVVVDEIGPGSVVLRVPIAGNANHLGTMYAGALFALAELPGGLLPLAVLDAARYVPIVTDVEVHFVAAARSDVTLTARMDPDQVRALGARVDVEGQSSFALEAEGRDADGRTVMASTAYYVLLPARALHAGLHGVDPDRGGTGHPGAGAVSRIAKPAPAPAPPPTLGTARPATPALDAAVLADLAADLGEPGVVIEALDIYVEELPGRVASIMRASSAERLSVLTETAHTLKSASRMLGAGHLADLCAAVETAAAATSHGFDASDLPTLVDALRSEAHRVAAAVADLQESGHSWVGQDGAAPT